MVRAFRWSRAVLVLAAVGIASAAFAVDLLEKMQAEVAAIVKTSKGAVVTIEDDVLQGAWFDGDAIKDVVVDANLHKEIANAIRDARKELSKLAEEKEKRDTAAVRELRSKLRELENKEALS